MLNSRKLLFVAAFLLVLPLAHAISDPELIPIVKDVVRSDDSFTSEERAAILRSLSTEELRLETALKLDVEQENLGFLVENSRQTRLSVDALVASFDVLRGKEFSVTTAVVQRDALRQVLTCLEAGMSFDELLQLVDAANYEATNQPNVYSALKISAPAGYANSPSVARGDVYTISGLDCLGPQAFVHESLGKQRLTPADLVRLRARAFDVYVKGDETYRVVLRSGYLRGSGLHYAVSNPVFRALVLQYDRLKKSSTGEVSVGDEAQALFDMAQEFRPLNPALSMNTFSSVVSLYGGVPEAASLVQRAGQHAKLLQQQMPAYYQNALYSCVINTIDGALIFAPITFLTAGAGRGVQLSMVFTGISTLAVQASNWNSFTFNQKKEFVCSVALPLLVAGSARSFKRVASRSPTTLPAGATLIEETAFSKRPSPMTLAANALRKAKTAFAELRQRSEGAFLDSRARQRVAQTLREAYGQACRSPCDPAKLTSETVKRAVIDALPAARQSESWVRLLAERWRKPLSAQSKLERTVNVETFEVDVRAKRIRSRQGFGTQQQTANDPILRGAPDEYTFLGVEGETANYGQVTYQLKTTIGDVLTESTLSDRPNVFEFLPQVKYGKAQKQFLALQEQDVGTFDAFSRTNRVGERLDRLLRNANDFREQRAAVYESGSTQAVSAFAKKSGARFLTVQVRARYGAGFGFDEVERILVRGRNLEEANALRLRVIETLRSNGVTQIGGRSVETAIGVDPLPVLALAA